MGPQTAVAVFGPTVLPFSSPSNLVCNRAFFDSGYPRLLTLNVGPVIVYVDEGWGASVLSGVEAAVTDAASAAHWSQTPDYLIAFCWRDSHTPMVDLWCFSKNPVDDISGPIVEAQVLRAGEPTLERGIASGNTLIVLGLEEQRRRATTGLPDYLRSRPLLPPGLLKGHKRP